MSFFLIAVLASWALLALGRESLIALAAGMALLDFGVNGAQVSNQTVIYALRPEARSRMTTAYSMSFFTGGATGSLFAATVYGSAGWGASCLLGAALAAAALAVWFATRPLPGGKH
jgi:cyanate permease